MRRISRILITKNNYSQYIRADSKELYLEKNMILSPGAIDILRNEGVVINYNSPAQKDTKGTKSLKSSIESILEKEFKIRDEGVMNKLVTLIIKQYESDGGKLNEY